MTDKYATRLINAVKTNGDKGLEKITSLALTSSIFVLFNNYMFDQMMHRYWA
jgi:hypothetical protein